MIPLNEAIHIDSKGFQWRESCDLAYRRLKIQLSKALVMIPPNWRVDFHIFVDASDVAIGSVLMQEQQAGWFCPIYYANCRLSVVEKNYSVMEWECLGMVYSVRKFRHYLLGRRFFFHVDHSALLYLVWQQHLTGRLAWWVLLLEEFDFEFIHRPGAEHVVAHYLSQLDFGEFAVGVDDEFSNAFLFTVCAPSVEL